MIERTFQDIPDGKIEDADQHEFLVSLGWSIGTSWGELLQSKRILIVSEAGAGKTYECKVQSQRLSNAGAPAFFVELSSLASANLRDLFDSEEEARLDGWLASPDEEATFFLDSVDELKLTQHSFELALKRFKKEIKDQLHRARIVITTRPIPFDESLIRTLLPIPPAQPKGTKEERFAEIMTRERLQQHDADDANEPLGWRLVALMPLSDEQIKEFASQQRVEKPDLLLKALLRRKAQSFARRPQDLIELCADWRENQLHVRTHRDQVKTNIRVKLEARVDRREACELSSNKAWEGASRLALAMQVMRLFTIRHSAASDITRGDAALNPLRILSDWQPNEVKTLLERPLFGFASYGRVRFHHRSVMEFLAAERLTYLREQRMPLKALRRLIFAETKDKIIVRPSKRPVAAWLALNIPSIFELLRDNEPEVLLNEGDPEALSLAQRKEILRAFAKRYCSSGWRGMDVPSIQVERFASADLADEIRKIWLEGMENPEVRIFLLGLIGGGGITSSAADVYDLLNSTNSSASDKIIALRTLAVLNDKSLYEVSAHIAEGDTYGSKRFVSRAVAVLFPQFMSADQLCKILRWIESKENTLWEGSRYITSIITSSESEIDYDVLVVLRESFVALLSEGLRWQHEWPHITSDFPQYCGILAAICLQGLKQDVNKSWCQATVLALCLFNIHFFGISESIQNLREYLFDLSATDNCFLFWCADAFVQSLHFNSDFFRRFFAASGKYSLVSLRFDRDYEWINNSLANKNRTVDDRAMLLEAVLHITPVHEIVGERRKKIESLVEDNPLLLKIFNTRVKVQIKNKKTSLRFSRKENSREDQKNRADAKRRAAWIEFWRSVTNKPDCEFSSEKSFATAWNLWNFMRRMSDDNTLSVWNRSAIEDFFDRATADRLQSVLTTIWRTESPTLPYERPVGSHNSYSERWELGLAAISAEAEDSEWAKKLTEEEALKAARHALLELNGLPQWIGTLVDAHPSAAEILWKEVSWELEQTPEVGSNSWLLQQLGDAPENVAKLFLPRLLTWLESGSACHDDIIATVMAYRLRHATRPIIKYGDIATKAKLAQIAQERLACFLSAELRDVWLSTLLQIDPERGVVAFENFASTVEPSARSEVVSCFSRFFGNRDSAVSLHNKLFTPRLLLRLLRLAYQHVRVEDDVHREGVFSPDARDDAQMARHNISNALFRIKGDEGFSAQLEMAADPLCGHLKDRLIAMADENWAQEIDAHAYDEQQAIALDKSCEAPAASNEAMFGILKDRLSDLDDFLLRDTSSRELWAGIDKEWILRRAIARELEIAANSLYTVDQEAVTADEKETDIRLRSVVGGYEAVIELKLGNERTAKYLRDTIKNQLVKKYLAAEKSRAGALLVAISKNRQWEHPDEGKKINIGELTELLRNEAERVQIALGSKVFIMIHLLDLRPRLSTEKKAKIKV